jgi:hypothetical protein
MKQVRQYISDNLPALPHPIHEQTYADDINMTYQLQRETDINILHQLKTTMINIFSVNSMIINEDKTTINTLNWIDKTTINHLGTYLDPIDDLNHRMTLATIAFKQLGKLWYRRRLVNITTKINIYKATIPPILLYNLHTWAYSQQHLQALDNFVTNHLKQIIYQGYKTQLTDLYYEARTCPVSKTLLEQRWHLLGHVLRCQLRQEANQNPSLPAYTMMEEYYIQNAIYRKRGAPPTSLPTVLHRELQAAETNLSLRTLHDLHQLKLTARHQPRTGIQQWRNLEQQIINHYGNIFNRRKEHAAELRRTNRLHKIIHSSPATATRLMVDDSYYRKTINYKPQDVQTPPHFDFRKLHRNLPALQIPRMEGIQEEKED